MSEALHIYVASPYTVGNQDQNRRNSIEYGEIILNKGHYPFLPLAVTSQWEDMYPKHYEQWMDYDFGWVRKCDALYRGKGESSGADREVALAQELGKIVFWELDEIPDLTRE